MPVEALLATIASERPNIAVVAGIVADHLRPLAAEREGLRAILADAGTRLLWGGPGAEPAPTYGLPGTVVSTVDDAVANLHPLA